MNSLAVFTIECRTNMILETATAMTKMPQRKMKYHHYGIKTTVKENLPENICIGYKAFTGKTKEKYAYQIRWNQPNLKMTKFISSVL